MDLTIRRAAPADEPVLVAFNAALAWETEHKRLDEAVLRAGVRAVFGDPAKGFYTVAERDGRVVGQVMVTFEWSDWRNGWFWWIQSVYVAEEARRGGIFRGLFEEVRRLAAAGPAVIGVRLYMERDNARAGETYRALGMAETTYHVLELYPLPGRQDNVG